MVDGYDELPPEYQKKVQFALDNGHVSDEDWKGDVDCNRPGQKGFRVKVKTPKKKKGKTADKVCTEKLVAYAMLTSLRTLTKRSPSQRRSVDARPKRTTVKRLPLPRNPAVRRQQSRKRRPSTAKPKSPSQRRGLGGRSSQCTRKSPKARPKIQSRK
jgi:hypothetical protein